VEKTAFIQLTHVYQPTFESDGAWGVQRQCLPNVTYVVKLSFTEISYCTCEWALQGNMCKHQIVVILTCTNITQEDIIHYCGNGMDHIMKGRVTCLWTRDIFQMIWNPMVMTKMNILKVMMGSWSSMGSRPGSRVISLWVPFVGSSDTTNSSTLMERAFAQLVTILQEITNECKKGDVTLCEHATSHMKVLACNIHNICLTKVNVILHLGFVLHHVEDGLGNSVNRLKDWHETMFNHTTVRTK